MQLRANEDLKPAGTLSFAWGVSPTSFGPEPAGKTTRRQETTMKNQPPLTESINPVRNSRNRSSCNCGAVAGFLIAFVLTCFALSPPAHAACQEGCGGNFNTFLGESALMNSTGIGNTATGAFALAANTTGQNNTATGIDALGSNFTGSNNTAIGSEALRYNNPAGNNNTAIGARTLLIATGSNNTAIGEEAMGLLGDAPSTGSNNTATGYQALFNVTSGSENTAIGAEALSSNTTASNNVAIGSDTLAYNTTGSDNTASGVDALFSNETGNYNTAYGSAALASNTTSNDNTATGQAALNQNTIGGDNTATGFQALLDNISGAGNTATGVNALYSNTRGSNNIGLGIGAGGALTTGDNNIDIANAGVAGESAKIRIGTKGTHKNTYIAGIYGVTVARGIGVIVDSTGHLGTTTSSARFKEAIKPMDKASEAILALEPVTFHYKPELDPEGVPQFGLVAEDVAKVHPDLVVRDAEGRPYTVRYEAVNAMLLNEFLKEHRKVESLEAAVAQQQKQIEILAAGLQKISNQAAIPTLPGRVVAGN